MLRAIVSLFLVSSCLAAADGAKVTPSEQEEEVRWLASLGLKPPATAFPLEDPYAMPFTRRSLVAPTAWYRQKTQDALRADQFREDLKVLHKIMETAYGGWGTAKKRGWNWARFFADWDATLAAKGDASLPLMEAFAPWRKFMEFQLDNHSGPIRATSKEVGHAVSWTAVLAGAPAGTCTEFRNAKGTFYPMDASDPAQNPKKREDAAGKPLYYVVTPNTKGPVVSVHCGATWIAAEAAWMPEYSERTANILALAQTEKDVPSFRSISPRIGYIRFPTFSKPAVELARELEKQLKGREHKEELLIVDLRNNDGGDMRIEALGNWTKFPKHGARTYLGASCLYPALRWGYTQISSMGLKPPISDALRNNLQHTLDALFEDDAAGCPAKFIETPAVWNYTQHQYPSKPAGATRLLALTDDFCGSDCDGAIGVIAAVPGSVIAGTNTLGVAQFIQPGYFMLPNTRLQFRVALGTSDNYGDGRSFDGYGFDVDIVLANKKDQSPESILGLANRLIGPEAR